MTVGATLRLISRFSRSPRLCPSIRGSLPAIQIFNRSINSTLWRTGDSFITRNATTAAPSSSSSNQLVDSPLDHVTYERVCGDTLNALCDYFEQLLEDADHIKNSDVSYGDGVLTVKLGLEYGTYVINRQTPNKQIWLSSPTSGPKRYDFVGPQSGDSGKWIYKHTGESIHELLQKEIEPIMKDQVVDFYQLPYSR